MRAELGNLKIKVLKVLLGVERSETSVISV